MKGADILVTDMWVSMGQEEEMAKRLKAFAGNRLWAAIAVIEAFVVNRGKVGAS